MGIKRLHNRKFQNFNELKAIARTIVKDASSSILASTTTTTTTTTSNYTKGKGKGKGKLPPPPSSYYADDYAAVSEPVPAAATGSPPVYPPDWKGWTNEVVIERVPFTKQVTQFEEVSVLVAMHGQGAANAFFMKPGSSLLLVVPPGLESEKFLFANLAVASGINVFMLDQEAKALDGSVTLDSLSKMVEAAKIQKEVWVDPVKFEAMLQAATAIATSGAAPVEEARIHLWDEVNARVEAERQAKAEEKKQAAGAGRKAAESAAGTRTGGAAEGSERNRGGASKGGTP